MFGSLSPNPSPLSPLLPHPQCWDRRSGGRGAVPLLPGLRDGYYTCRYSTSTPPCLSSGRFKCFHCDIPPHALVWWTLAPRSLAPCPVRCPPSSLPLSPPLSLLTSLSYRVSLMGYFRSDSFNIFALSVITIQRPHGVPPTSPDLQAVGVPCTGGPSTCGLPLCLHLMPVLF